MGRERGEKERYMKQEHEKMMEKKKENKKQRMAEGRKMITKTELMKLNLIILLRFFSLESESNYNLNVTQLVFIKVRARKKSEDGGKEWCEIEGK